MGCTNKGVFSKMYVANRDNRKRTFINNSYMNQIEIFNHDICWLLNEAEITKYAWKQAQLHVYGLVRMCNA